MAFSVQMPALGESVTEGTVTRWLKGEGDLVEAGEPLLEVSTDKVDTEIVSPASGPLQRIVAAEDETVEVGGELAVIGDVSVQTATPPPAPLPPAPTTLTRTGKPKGAPYVAVPVRKLAAEHGIDLTSVRGTGVSGRIRKQDVLVLVEAKQAPDTSQPPAPETTVSAASVTSSPLPAASVTPSPAAGAIRGKTEKLSRLRQIIAQRTRESLAVSAQLTQVFEVDVTKIAQLRDRSKGAFAESEGIKLTYLPFFAKAVVEALKQHPTLNASINEEANTVTYHGTENLGIAIDTERGLFNAVIHDAGKLNLTGLAHKIADLAERSRAQTVTPEELTGGTFSLTNLGSNGALFDTPILQQPQVGILGVGSVVKRPVVLTSADDGSYTISIRSMAYLALTYDHRLVDGADAGRFLTTVKKRLEEGNFETEIDL